MISARIIYGLILVLICCFGVYRLLDASNKMNDERISHIQLLFKPDKAALLHFKGTPEDVDKWSQQIEKFLARECTRLNN